MAMLVRDCASHGITPNDSNVVLGSVGARIRLVGPETWSESTEVGFGGEFFGALRLIREGTLTNELVVFSSSSSSRGESLRFFGDGVAFSLRESSDILSDILAAIVTKIRFGITGDSG